MDKLSKLTMPDVKSGTPQEKMNAVKKALQSLEMITEAYNQIVPVINAKIDWLAESEKVAKDGAQDKKINELITTNKELMDRISELESKKEAAVIEKLESFDKRLDFIRRTYSEKWESIQHSAHKEKISTQSRLDEIEQSIKNLVG